jgi:hypothetical protein
MSAGAHLIDFAVSRRETSGTGRPFFCFNLYPTRHPRVTSGDYAGEAGCGAAHGYFDRQTGASR